MATNLGIDDKLLREALKIGGLNTKKDTVNQALREFVNHRRQSRIVRAFGKIEYTRGYRPKDARRR